MRAATLSPRDRVRFTGDGFESRRGMRLEGGTILSSPAGEIASVVTWELRAFSRQVKQERLVQLTLPRSMRFERAPLHCVA